MAICTDSYTIWPWAAMTITRTGQRSDKKLPDIKKQRRRRRGRPSRRRNQGRPSGCRMKPLPVSATEIMPLARLAGEELPGSRVWISRLRNLQSTLDVSGFVFRCSDAASYTLESPKSIRANPRACGGVWTSVFSHKSLGESVSGARGVRF